MPKTSLYSGIRATYDPAADAFYMALAPNVKISATRQLGPDSYADFDAAGGLIGVEVLNASQHYGREVLERLASPVEYLTLAEAASESGLSPTTLRNRIRAGRLPAIKRGRDWLVAGNELWNYLESRAPQGRRSRKERQRTGASRRSGSGSR